MSRPKEKYARFNPKEASSVTLAPHPFENELEGMAFVTLCQMTMFRGQHTPANFRYYERFIYQIEEPENGEVIGQSENGQDLHWEQGQVIARDRGRKDES